MRKFGFNELAYAIVVASSYGLLMGLLYNSSSDIFILFIWVGLICLHLAGIVLIERLERNKKKKNPPL